MSIFGKLEMYYYLYHRLDFVDMGKWAINNQIYYNYKVLNINWLIEIMLKYLSFPFSVLLSPGSGPQPADAELGGRDNPPITGAGRCDRRDSLTIRGPTERNPPLVCGTLTGQHSTHKFFFIEILLINKQKYNIQYFIHNFWNYIISFLVYVETGLFEGASTRLQISINGEVIGLRKWKVNALIYSVILKWALSISVK